MLCSNCGEKIPEGEEVTEGIEYGSGGKIICQSCWKSRKNRVKITWIVIFSLSILVGLGLLIYFFIKKS